MGVEIRPEKLVADPIEIIAKEDTVGTHTFRQAVLDLPQGEVDPSDERSPDQLVEVGDTVIVRFSDDRVRRFRLSREANKPDQGIVHIGQPIGQALLGNGIDEEVDLVIDGHTKRVIIEKITKAAA